MYEVAFDFYWYVNVASELPALKMKEKRHGINQSAVDWNLILNVLVLGGGSIRRWLGHEGEALANEISAPIKETPQSFLAPSTMWGSTMWSYMAKDWTKEPPLTRHQICQLLGFLASRSLRNKLPSLWYSAIAAQIDQDTTVQCLFLHNVLGLE